MIPSDIDVLITHGPPKGVLDKCRDGRRVGCPHLLYRVEAIQPVMHIFGHIHESRGICIRDSVVFVNTSSLDEKYRLRDSGPAFVFDYDELVVTYSNRKENT